MSARATTMRLARCRAAFPVTFALALVCALAPAQSAWAAYYYEGAVDTSWYDESRDAFTLTTKEQLAGLAYLVQDGVDSFQGKTVLLGADIDLAGEEWYPIGDPYQSKCSFRGMFDGQGHTVTGLYIYNEMQNMALFGTVEGATICNLEVHGSVTASNYAAGIVASASSSTLRDLTNYTDVIGGGTNAYIDTSARYNGDAAGVACKSIRLGAGETTYENLVNYGSIRGASPSGTGGCIGSIACGEGATFNIVNCANHGDVYIANTENVDGVDDGAGGVVGSTGTIGTYHIVGCTNTGSITSNNLGSVGGVVGFVGGVGSTVDHSGNEGVITNLSTEFDSPTEDVPTAGGVVSRFNSEGGAVTNNYSADITSASTGHSAAIIGSSEQGASIASNNYYLEGTATGAFNDSSTGVASDQMLGGEAVTAEELADLLDVENGGVKALDLSSYEMVPIDSVVVETAAETSIDVQTLALMQALMALVAAAALVAGAAVEYRRFALQARPLAKGGAHA